VHQIHRLKIQSGGNYGKNYVLNLHVAYQCSLHLCDPALPVSNTSQNKWSELSGISFIEMVSGGFVNGQQISVDGQRTLQLQFDAVCASSTRVTLFSNSAEDSWIDEHQVMTTSAKLRPLSQRAITNATDQRTAFRSSGGRILVQVNASAGARVRVVHTNPADSVRNLRLVPLEFEETYEQDPFHPEFIDSICSIDVLRFSSWQMYNSNSYNDHNAPNDWVARPLTTWQTQVKAKGMALKFITLLANRINTSVWITMSRTAGARNGFIQEAAHFFRADCTLQLSA
jgi:hypothetical protein